MPPDDADRPPGWRTLALVLAAYAAALALATDPAAGSLATRLPSAADPLQHLWIMRWNASCLRDGRLPFLCPDLQCPVGAPLGNFSPLHLQSLIYAILSSFIGNDVLCYNVLWASGFLATGLGTFALAWYAVRDRAAAALAGMLGMLAGPLMLHGAGHLELIHLGAFPLFLVAWLRFVDRPRAGRLLAAAGLYLALAMSAAYFAVLAVPPAALYVAWRMAASGWRGTGAWLRGRAAWLAAFAASVGPGLALIFSSQLWAAAHGGTLVRSREHFDRSGAPLWGYAAPTSIHRLGKALPCVAYDVMGSALAPERASYLGVVTLGLVAYAAACRVRFRRAGFWWAALALLVVLSCGSSWTFGRWRVPLPAAWLWRTVYVFRLIRTPCRFNLLATTCAAVVAAAGLRHLLGRFPSRPARAALTTALALVAVADLGLTPPAGRCAVPPLPPCYEFVLRRDPRATFVDAPQFASGSPAVLNALCGYWQSLHRGRTTAGYSGVPNLAWDHRVGLPSPFAAECLANPAFLRRPDDAWIDVVHHVAYRDYAWLYLTALGLDYVVLHTDKARVPEAPIADLKALKSLLAEALVFEDRATAVYARSRLRPPMRPTLLCAEGWGGRDPVGPRSGRALDPTAQLAVYNPAPGRPLVLSVEAYATGRRPRRLRVLRGATELGRIELAPGATGWLVTPPFRLPAGLGRLTIEHVADGRGAGELRVLTLSLQPADPPP
jgi:hypothetical protein